jgi:O-antigen/teichoic acid export membrane protein
LKKHFIENLTFFIALNLLIKPIYVFGIDRVVQNTVGTEIYGTYFPLLNLVLIFQIFLDLGIENFTRKEIAHNPGLTNRLFTSFFAFKLVLIIAFIVLFSIAGLFIPHSKEEWLMLIFLVINQGMASFILYLRANMGGLHLFKAESIVSVLDRFTMVIICGTLLLIPFTRGQFKIQWFIYSQTIAYLITLIVSLTIVLKKTKTFTISLKLSSYLPILKQLKPYAILILLMSFYYRVDSIFLRFLLPDGKEQAGIYAHGFRILDFMANYALIFSFILLPTFSKMIRMKENIAPLLRLAGLSLLIPSVAILTGIAFYRFDVFTLLYPDSTQESANVFTILIISFIGICISYTFGALLTANGNLKELIKMALIAVGISTVFNLVFIPLYKAEGAAIANAIAQLFTIVYHILVSKRKFNLKTDFTLLFKLGAFLLFTIVTGAFITKIHVNWIVGIFTITSISVLFATAIKLIQLKNILALLKNYLPAK